MEAEIHLTCPAPPAGLTRGGCACVLSHLENPLSTSHPTHLMAPWPDLGSPGRVHPFPEGGGLGKFKGKTSLVNQEGSSGYQHHPGGR